MESWRRLKLVQWSFLGVVLLGPALLALTGLAIARWHWSFLRLAIPCIAIAFLGGMGALGLTWTLWRCPQCHRRFFTNFIVTNQFSRKCMHCGLPKWAEPTSENIDELKQPNTDGQH